jgi:hypothetical protein
MAAPDVELRVVARIRVTPPEKWPLAVPLRKGMRASVSVSGRYYPSQIMDVRGDSIPPGAEGVLTLSVMDTDDMPSGIAPGVSIELRAGPTLVAAGQALKIDVFR